MSIDGQGCWPLLPLDPSHCQVANPPARAVLGGDAGPMTVTIDALPASIVQTAVREWVDKEGGAPLRCCLRDSRRGERVALVSVTPPGPMGAYRETGPVFMHADGCDGASSRTYPDDFRSRPQIFRTYDAAGSIIGGELVDAGKWPGGGGRATAR